MADHYFGNLASAVPGNNRGRFDLPGAVVLFAGLFVLILALSFARVDGWLAPLPVLLYAATVILGLVFAGGRKSGRFTILPAGLTAFSGLKPGAGSNLLITMAAFVMWFLFPFYVADVMGRSGLTLGALLALMAATNFAGSAVAGWLADRVGDRQITFLGAAMTAVGLLMVGTAGSSPTMGHVVFATVVLGFGFGIHQAAVYALTLRGTPSERVGATSAALTVSQTIGTVLSISVMTTLLTWQQSVNGGSFVEAYRFSYIAAAAIAVAAGVVVLRRPRSRV